MGAVVHSPSFSAMRMEFFTAGPYNSCVSSPSAEFFSTQHLLTDPIGTTTVTFSGVNAGSEIRVYLPDGTALTGIETCADNQVLSWSVYAPGSPNNTVTITILLRGYRWQEFSLASVVGSQTIPIFQIIDLGWTP